MREQKPRREIVISNVIERDGKFLLIKEKKNTEKIGGGKWNLPGGSLEHKEDIVDCAIREGKEETGLSLKPTHLILRLDFGSFSDPTADLLSIIVKSEIIKGEPIVTKNVEDVQWFTIDQIRKMKRQNKLKTSCVTKSIEACIVGKMIPLNAIDIESFYVIL